MILPLLRRGAEWWQFAAAELEPRPNRHRECAAEPLNPAKHPTHPTNTSLAGVRTKSTSCSLSFSLGSIYNKIQCESLWIVWEGKIRANKLDTETVVKGIRTE